MLRFSSVVTCGDEMPKTILFSSFHEHTLSLCLFFQLLCPFLNIFFTYFPTLSPISLFFFILSPTPSLLFSISFTLTLHPLPFYSRFYHLPLLFTSSLHPFIFCIISSLTPTPSQRSRLSLFTLTSLWFTSYSQPLFYLINYSFSFARSPTLLNL